MSGGDVRTFRGGDPLSPHYLMVDIVGSGSIGLLDASRYTQLREAFLSATIDGPSLTLIAAFGRCTCGALADIGHDMTALSAMHPDFRSFIAFAQAFAERNEYRISDAFAQHVIAADRRTA